MGSVEKEGVRRSLKVVICGVAAGLKHHGETSRGAESRDDGRAADVYLAFRIQGKGVPNHLHHLVDVGLFALVPWLHYDSQGAVGLARADSRA